MKTLNSNFWRNQKVLLTGHTGFKGAWTALVLEEMGAEVYGLSLEPATEPNLYNIIAPRLKLKSTLIDIRDRNSLTACVKEIEPDIVIHMAAQALVRESYNNPLDTIDSNVLGTVNLLEALRESISLKAVLVITSDKVYENNNNIVAFSEDNKLGGHDPYSASKAAAEILTASYAKSYFAGRGIPVCTARAGNVIGGGDWATDRIIPDLWRAYSSGQAIELRYPAAIRPWQHVLEPIFGYLLYIERMVAEPSTTPTALNFGSATEQNHTVLDIAKYFATTLNVQHELWTIGIPNAQQKESKYLSINPLLANLKLGWQSILSFDQAITWTCAWYKAFQDGADMLQYSIEQINQYDSLVLSNIASEPTNKIAIQKEFVLAVIGGGRWGRIHLTELIKLAPCVDRIVVVSKHNSTTIEEFIDKQSSANRVPVSIVASIEELNSKYNVKYALIVNSARQHYETALQLLECGVHILIEKPVVLTTVQAQALLDKAIAKGVSIVPSLQYRFCSYLKNFSEIIEQLGEEPVNFTLQWSDSNGEIRYNEVKKHDTSIDVAQDVMPHVWTILETVFKHTEFNVVDCQANNMDKAAFIVDTSAGLHGQVLLERNATARSRIMTVNFSNGSKVSIDFSIEPGIISFGADQVTGDMHWETAERPVSKQLRYFLTSCLEPRTKQTDYIACLNSVSFSENASELLNSAVSKLSATV